MAPGAGVCVKGCARNVAITEGGFIIPVAAACTHIYACCAYPIVGRGEDIPVKKQENQRAE